MVDQTTQRDLHDGRDGGGSLEEHLISTASPTCPSQFTEASTSSNSSTPRHSLQFPDSSRVHSRPASQHDDVVEDDSPGSKAIPLQHITATALPRFPAHAYTQVPLDASAVQDANLQEKKRKSLLRIWLFEIASAMCSLICMVLTIAVMAASENRPLDDWRLPISPNALVSVFLTLAQTAMACVVNEGVSQLKWIYFQQRRYRLYDMQMFDEASRGPWGAFMLIGRLRLRALVASVGATITVLALAMGPFAQQVLQYNTVMRNATNGLATISSAHAFDDGAPDLSAEVDDFQDSSIYPNLTNAMFTGMFSATLQPAYQCSTANCTFPAFSTLAICGECQNLTNSTTSQCNVATANFSTGLQTCNYSIPGGAVISGYSEVNPGPEEDAYTTVLLNATVQISNTSSIPSNFANISFLRFPGPNSQNYGLLQPTAFLCQMRWCQKTYPETNVSSGQYFENSLFSEVVEFPDCSDDGNGRWSSSNNVTNCPGFAQGQVPSNLSSYNLTTLNNTNALWLNKANSHTVINWFQTMFTVSAIDRGRNVPENVLADVLSSSLWQLNDGNLTQTMTDIATAMTNTIRSGPNATLVVGNALTPTTVVFVSWPWLILPAALVVSSLAFLAAAITFSAAPDSALWKSSALATFFHRLEGWDSSYLNLDDNEEMEQKAKEMQVQLKPGVDGRVAFCRW